ncbi:MAG: hypothetical protein H7A23_11840 [Leptospiraceae bacterium]|nr:hypothetical protein [Leptospiraceae bacterium]
MPIYEYKCATCGKEIEVLQTTHKNYEYCNEIDASCEKGGKVSRLISSFAFAGSDSPSNDFCNAGCFETKKEREHVHSGSCGCHGGFCSSN